MTNSPRYWDQPDHHPHLIRVDGTVAGFALVRPCPDEPGRFEIGEFFVARKFKGCGVGRDCAFRLFGAFPGKWLVRVLNDNTGARRFWEKVVREYSGGNFEQTEEQYTCPRSGTWLMQFYRFESRTS